MSRMPALRIVRFSLIRSKPFAAHDSDITLSIGHPHWGNQWSKQASADPISRQQFRDNAGSGAGSDYHFGRSRLKRFQSRFQFRAHATSGDSGIDKLPALI